MPMDNSRNMQECVCIQELLQFFVTNLSVCVWLAREMYNIKTGCMFEWAPSRSERGGA
jgi:hypothetical protein